MAIQTKATVEFFQQLLYCFSVRGGLNFESVDESLLRSTNSCGAVYYIIQVDPTFYSVNEQNS